MRRHRHRIRFGNSIHTPRPGSAPEKSAPDKIWHSLLTWNTRLDEDTLEALSEALRPQRLRAG